ncbi:MAG: hypothetical protein WCI92_00605 [Bacteroidota bacterium]
MKKQANEDEIIVRTWGSNIWSRIEFYKIVGQKSKAQFYMQKLDAEFIIGDASYGYYIPTNEYIDGIKIIQRVKEGYRFEEFQCKRKDDRHYNILYFQENEKQFEWIGYPVKYDPFNRINIKEIDDKYQDYILPLERRKKLERLNSI